MKRSYYTLSKGILLSFTFLLSGLVSAQIPSGYYNSASGLTGDSLKDALHDIIDGHTEYPYSSSGTDVWDILKEADQDPNDTNNVLGIYSGFSMDAAAEYNSGSGWNREHVWAKSRGNFGTSKGAGTDLHHIRAADISTNSARNNRNFDEATTQYVDNSGNYSGTTDAYTSSTDWIWEPPADVKGDVARMIFYMTVRYEGTNGEPDLELTDNLLTSTDQSPLHGKASVLVQWHLDDPVSSAEIARNDVVYSYQNNRNPFIDHPEYVCEIYGSYCSGGGSGGGDDLFISEYIEGSSNNKGLEIANTSGSAVDLSDYSLKKQTNGAGSWGSEYSLTGTLNDGDVYVIVNSSASSSMTAVADVTTGSGIVTFNGNDPIGLFKNGTLIDIVGTFDGGSSNFAQNTTLVRKSSITGPNDTYTSTEWDDYASDTFSYLGDHTGSGSGSGSSDLFLSEYIEGSSYNKGLEIANTTGSSVDLSDYSLKKQTNGAGSWGSEYTLSGTLNDGDVYVIVNSSASSSMTAVADVTTGSGIVTFNGNDPIGLFKNGTLIDIIGTFDGGSSNFAQNTTLVRKSTVSDPNTTYTTSEWDTYASNTFSYLGSHSGSGGGSGSSDLFLSEYIEGSSYNKGLEIANNTGSSVDLSDYSLKKQTNGAGSWGSEYTLSGTLSDGNVYVIVNSSASSSMTSVADVTTGSGIVTFNGNDPIGLFKNGTLIDIIGTFDGGSSNFAQNTTLVRKSSVSDPNTTYTTSEWDTYASNTFSYLGNHSSSRFKALPVLQEVEASIYPNPASNQLNVRVEEAPVVNLRVVDMQGKVVLEVQPLSLQFQLDVSSLEKGMYLLWMQNATGNISTDRFSVH